MSVLAWTDPVPPQNAEEQLLLAPLVQFLKQRRWINERSLLRTEFSWNGRRADLVTMTQTARLSAFELKIGSFHRVLEQAMYNRLAFDRSWAVVSSRPLERNLEQAAENGIGVLLLLSGHMQVLLQATVQPVNRIARSRLLVDLKKGITADV